MAQLYQNNLEPRLFLIGYKCLLFTLKNFRKHVGGRVYRRFIKVYRRFMVYKGFYLVIYSCVVIKKVKKDEEAKA